MQVYPEKSDKLELISAERSFIRTIERAYSDSDMGYFVLHINPRKKDVGKGTPELFDMLLCSDGILLFRFFDTQNEMVANATIKAMSNPLVFGTLMKDIREKLEESKYLLDGRGKLKYDINIVLVFPNVEQGKAAEGLLAPEIKF